MKIANLTQIIKKLDFQPKKVISAKPNGLLQDTYEFSKKTQKTSAFSFLQKIKNKLNELKWNNPYKNYEVKAYKNCEIEQHHEINGINCSLRSVYEKALKTENLDDERTQRSLDIYLNKIKRIDEDFNKMQPLEKDCIVYRGRTENPASSRFNKDFSIIENAKVGDIITPDTGYSYCGIKKKLAKKWADPVEGRSSIMYEIRLPKGSQVSRNYEHGGEVLMPRNAQYRVIKKETEGQHTNIILEYILPKKNQNIDEINSLLEKFGLTDKAS